MQKLVICGRHTLHLQLCLCVDQKNLNVVLLPAKITVLEMLIIF